MASRTSAAGSGGSGDCARAAGSACASIRMLASVRSFTSTSSYLANPELELASYGRLSRRNGSLTDSVPLSSPPPRIERRRPQCDVGTVAQGHGHLSGGAIYLDVTEELHAARRRQVLLVEAGRLDEFHLGPKRIVE